MRRIQLACSRKLGQRSQPERPRCLMVTRNKVQGSLRAWKSQPQLRAAESWLEANLLGQAGSRHTKQKPKRLDLEVAALNLSSLRRLSQKCCLSLTWAAGLAFREHWAFPGQPGRSFWNPHPDISQSQHGLGRGERVDERGTGEERERRRMFSWRGQEEGESDEEPTEKSIFISFVHGSQEVFLLFPSSSQHHGLYFPFKKELFFSARRSGQQSLAE